MLETSIQHLRISDNTISIKQQFTMNELIEGSGWLKHNVIWEEFVKNKDNLGIFCWGFLSLPGAVVRNTEMFK